MRKYQDISYQLIAILLIAVVGIHSLNSFFNTHSHRLANGSIITHAHPYDHSKDKDPLKTHHHNATELVFLASLHYFLPVFTFLSIGVAGFVGLKLISQFRFRISQSHTFNRPLRGPPLDY